MSAPVDVLAFKPKRSEVRHAQRCAAECEKNARAAAQLRHMGQPSGAYEQTAANYSRTAFLLANVVSSRGARA